MRRVTLVAVVQPHQLVSVQPVEGQDEHDQEVGNEQANVETVPAIRMAKGVIGVVRFPVVTQATGHPEGQRIQREGQKRTPWFKLNHLILR